jgi:methionine aminopeptidase
LTLELSALQVVTSNGKWSAQFEHTVLVAQNGYEILTPSE